VSSHIKDLEEHFGCRLIDRLAKEAAPTRAGELLYDCARRMIALKSETEALLAEFQGKIRGRLTVGGSTIPAGYILPQIIGGFCRAYPEVRVSLVEGDTEKIIEAVRIGNVELGIVGARSGEKKIAQEPLIDDRMLLIVPAGHRWAGRRRLALGRLFEEPFIVREDGSGTLKSIRESLSHSGYGIDDLNAVAEMGSTQSVIQGIKAGVGVSILSAVAVEADIGTGALSGVEVAGLELRRRFYLTRHRDRSASPLCGAFAEFLKAQCKTAADPPGSVA
jgi:DNA-binding transcriptional LysR family regulator